MQSILVALDDLLADVQDAPLVDRCVQLKERLTAIQQAFAGVDLALALKWDDLLAKGFDA